MRVSPQIRETPGRPPGQVEDWSFVIDMVHDDVAKHKSLERIHAVAVCEPEPVAFTTTATCLPLEGAGLCVSAPLARLGSGTCLRACSGYTLRVLCT